MKVYSLLSMVTMVCLSLTIQAQTIDYNKVVLPANVKSDNLEERLVQLAWQNMPQNAVIQNNKEIAAMRSKLVKWSWLDNISARGNLNEFAINPDASPSGTNLFPRYNLGVVIPLGIFISTPMESKIAHRQAMNAEEQMNQQKLLVRKQVLTAYNNYKMYTEILKIKNDLVEDEYANLLVVEEKFQKGQITIDQYKSVSRAYSLEIEEKIRTSNLLENAKLEIEALIGMKLEDIN